jgi:hypothetical protein
MITRLQWLLLLGGSSVLALFLWLTSVQLDLAKEQTRISKESNVYMRTTSCILSVPLATRTDNYIGQCYNKAEKSNDIKVDRFGNIK